MNIVTVVGLGSGDIDDLPLGVYRLLKRSGKTFLRTKEHPVVRELEEEGIQFFSFDHIYESFDTFSDVYEKIVETLLAEAEKQSIVYAVPGHPLVAEQTVQMLLEREKEGKVTVELAGGHSFLDALFQAATFDPIEGFQLLDATNFHKSQIQLRQHVIIGQVYDAITASHVKLELMELLPDTYEIYVIKSAGTKNERVEKIPLYLLDPDFDVHNLTSIYVPPVQDETILYKDFNYLREIIATLRGPNGCPWDKKQTHESLKRYLLEEAHEVLEAIDDQDDDHLVEELGDVLLQVMLHAQIGEDEGYFTIEDVISALSKKMIHRHPHVFGDKKVASEQEVIANWQKLKEQENPNREKRSVLADINKGLPALMQAYEIQKTVKKVGFDWGDYRPALAKVKEELTEFEAEIENEQSKEKITMELGDLLFAIVNVARLLSIYPEEALLATNRKFIRRFQYIEEQVEKSGKDFSDFTLAELDRFWEEAKMIEKNPEHQEK